MISNTHNYKTSQGKILFLLHGDFGLGSEGLIGKFTVESGINKKF